MCLALALVCDRELRFAENPENSFVDQSRLTHAKAHRHAVSQQYWPARPAGAVVFLWSYRGFAGCHFDLVDRGLVGRLADEIREIEAGSAGLARMTLSKAD
jgi:hypothetical protein